MKIGIITHHYVNNFGAFLQAYALTEALAGEFPDDRVELVDYLNVKQFFINSCGWFRYYRGRENLRGWLQKVRMPWIFAKARRQHLTCSKLCLSVKQVNRLNYDVLIVGSDEVWNYQDRRSTAKIKFGHGLTCENLIAYAPSVGNSRGEVPDYVREGLKKFSSVSVRDDLTGELVREVTGEQPERVLDPTFLCGFPTVETSRGKKPYILFYYCDHLPQDVKDQIFSYAKAHGLAVYGAGECDKRYDEITVDLTPFEWVEMFRGAEFVFTGTFHGAVFSILNHRPFKVHLTNKSRIRKVDSLLAECGLDDRKIGDGFVFDLDKMRDEIDYQAVEQRLDGHRAKSMDFLRRSIAGLRKD